MTKRPPRMPAAEGADGEVPPLETGMRMDRESFHRAYCRHPEVKKAELIGGVVFVASPVSVIHGRPNASLVGWAWVYASGNPGTTVVENTTLLIADGTECQPDLVLFREPTHGGRVTYTPDLYLAGVPELVGEISVSTEALDTGPRLEAYERAGVPEYVVWRTLSQAIDWYVLRSGRYELLPADAEGVVRSEAFPGLWLNAPAMLRGDMAAVLASLQTGVAARQGRST